SHRMPRCFWTHRGAIDTPRAAARTMPRTEERWLGVARFALPEDLDALDELLLKGDAWPTTRPILTLTLMLSRPPAAGRLEAAFDQAIGALPRMRQRVVQSAWTAGPASWI